MSAELDAKIAHMNKHIDAQVAVMTANGCPHYDIVFMNTVVRPFLEQMEIARTKPESTAFVKSAEWLVSLLISETLLNTVERKAEVIAPQAKAMLQRIAANVAQTLQDTINQPTQH